MPRSEGPQVSVTSRSNIGSTGLGQCWGQCQHYVRRHHGKCDVPGRARVRFKGGVDFAVVGRSMFASLIGQC